jgi:hypothetical protein
VSGTLAAGEPARVFQAEGVIPASVRARLAAGGTRLYTALGRFAMRRGEVHLRDRIYEIGALPAGPTVTELRADRWRPASEAGGSSDFFHAVAAAFRARQAGAILRSTAPVLVGEIADTAPVFTFTETGPPPGQRVTVVVIPLEQQ